MATPKIIADFETQLASTISIGSTSFTLASATDDDGVPLPNGKYFFTINNASTQKEYVVGTLSGTSVTSVSNVSRQGVQTSGTARAHRIGSSVIMTDFLTYKDYIDETTTAGAPDASTITKGVVEIATAAELNSGAATGGTGAIPVASAENLLASQYGLMLLGLVGSIIATARSSAPSGFLLCDGSAVSRTTYAALFSAIGTTYGVGDNSTTFNLPNLQGRIPVGRDTGQTEFDTLGETGGAKTHTLTESEIPAHTHDFQGYTVAGIGGSGISGWSATGNRQPLTVTGVTGGGGAHNNLQPYIVVNYIIKT